MMVKRSMGFSCHQMNKKAGEQMDTMAKIISLGRIKIDAFLVSTSCILFDLIYCLE